MKVVSDPSRAGWNLITIRALCIWQALFGVRASPHECRKMVTSSRSSPSRCLGRLRNTRFGFTGRLLRYVSTFCRLVRHWTQFTRQSSGPARCTVSCVKVDSRSEVDSGSCGRHSAWALVVSTGTWPQNEVHACNDMDKHMSSTPRPHHNHHTGSDKFVTFFFFCVANMWQLCEPTRAALRRRQRRLRSWWRHEQQCVGAAGQLWRLLEEFPLLRCLPRRADRSWKSGLCLRHRFFQSFWCFGVACGVRRIGFSGRVRCLVQQWIHFSNGFSVVSP